jgi:hypothetical protein
MGARRHPPELASLKFGQTTVTRRRGALKTPIEGREGPRRRKNMYSPIAVHKICCGLSYNGYGYPTYGGDRRCYNHELAEHDCTGVYVGCVRRTHHTTHNHTVCSPVDSGSHELPSIPGSLEMILCGKNAN